MTTAVADRSPESASLGSVSVADAMHPGVVTCRFDASLSTVARTMAAHRIHAVVLTPETESGEWSLVSDLDLAAAVGDGLLGSATAGRLASTPNVHVRVDETLPRAAQLMREYETHHLVVLARDANAPVGILSTLDIADVVARLPVDSAR